MSVLASITIYIELVVASKLVAVNSISCTMLVNKDKVWKNTLEKLIHNKVDETTAIHIYLCV